MCCFTTTTKVTGTNIFARLSAPGKQLLAYQMRYSAAQPTAMILPLPVHHPVREDSVRFTDLKAYARFFDALADGFPAM